MYGKCVFRQVHDTDERFTVGRAEHVLDEDAVVGAGLEGGVGFVQWR
ncbi:MAG: hypothetical protein U0169_27010 [Polyangiaceae bacterium]